MFSDCLMLYPEDLLLRICLEYGFADSGQTNEMTTDAMDSDSIKCDTVGQSNISRTT